MDKLPKPVRSTSPNGPSGPTGPSALSQPYHTNWTEPTESNLSFPDPKRSGRAEGPNRPIPTDRSDASEPFELFAPDTTRLSPLAQSGRHMWPGCCDLLIYFDSIWPVTSQYDCLTRSDWSAEVEAVQGLFAFTIVGSVSIVDRFSQALSNGAVESVGSGRVGRRVGKSQFVTGVARMGLSGRVGQSIWSVRWLGRFVRLRTQSVQLSSVLA